MVSVDKSIDRLCKLLEDLVDKHKADGVDYVNFVADYSLDTAAKDPKSDTAAFIGSTKFRTLCTFVNNHQASKQYTGQSLMDFLKS